MITIDNKELRNALEQIAKNKDDITEIKQGLGDALPNPIPGPQGPKGDVGSVIKTGHGLPYFIPEAEEQIYWIDLDTGKWYQYNKDLGWTVTAELKGKDGKQGKQGVQGIQGKPGLGIDTLNSINIGDNGTADVIYHDGVAHIENTGSLTYNVRDSKLVNTVLDLPIKGDNKISIDASADGESVEVKIDKTGATEGQVLGVVNGAIAWKSLPELPTLAPVATSGSYNDLTNKPNLATVATSGSYNDLTNKPDLKTVATTGNYNDLINKPTIPEVGDGIITIKQGDTIKGSFSVNDKTDKTIELDAGGGTADDKYVKKGDAIVKKPTEQDKNGDKKQIIQGNPNSDTENRIVFQTNSNKNTGACLGVLGDRSASDPKIVVGNTNTNRLGEGDYQNGYVLEIRPWGFKKYHGYDYWDIDLPERNNSYVHNLLSNHNVKTIFGQNIYSMDGTGNIDLYKHHLTVNGYGHDFYGDFYSSKSLQCDSLTDLKAILGNSFKLQMYGAASTGALGNGWYMAMYLDENALHLAGSNGTNSIQYNNLTIADEIRTI